MSVFVVGALDVHDWEIYNQYIAIARKSLEPFPESRVAADDAPVLLEGEFPGHRIVVLKFTDDAEFETWWNSDKYQEAIPFRYASATTQFLLKITGHGQQVISRK